MNSEEKSKITQNLTYMKEQLVFMLDPLIDRLIEVDVFRLDHRSQIEQISKPTPHRQFNEFIKILTSSPNSLAYTAFIDALEEEDHVAIVKRLQKTCPNKRSSMSSANIRTRRPTSSLSTANTGQPEYQREKSKVNLQNVGREAGGSGCNDCAKVVTSVLEKFGKDQQKLLENIERQRREDIHSIEQQRLRDRKEFQNELTMIMSRWQAEKREIIRQNENAIYQLQTQISELQKSSEEYAFLKEQYDYLKEKQKGLREKDNERVERMSKLNREKVELEKTNEKLNQELEDAELKFKERDIECQRLDDRTHALANQVEDLDFEKSKLKRDLEDKEGENKSLREKVFEQYNQIQELLQRQVQSPRKDDAEYVNTVEIQMRKLDEIYGMMQSFSKDKPAVVSAVIGRMELKPKKINPSITQRAAKKY